MMGELPAQDDPGVETIMCMEGFLIFVSDLFCMVNAYL